MLLTHYISTYIFFITDVLLRSIANLFPIGVAFLKQNNICSWIIPPHVLLCPHQRCHKCETPQKHFSKANVFHLSPLLLSQTFCNLSLLVVVFLKYLSRQSHCSPQVPLITFALAVHQNYVRHFQGLYPCVLYARKHP